MIKRLLRFWFCLSVALVVSGKSFALVREFENPQLSVSVISSSKVVAERTPIEFLFRFKLADGWHIYSETPGDAGMPTSVSWLSPSNFSVQESQWSRDERFEDEGIVQYGFTREAYYRVKMMPNGPLKQNADFNALVKWQACRGDECLPGKVKFSFSFPVTASEPQTNPEYLESLKTSEKYFSASGYIPDGLPMILLMAFVGGIILNFMPCVFPILTIKIIALAQGTTNKKESRTEALLYMLGVVVSFLLIASLLVVLRSQGEQIGWGFQLQSPTFVAVMSVVFFIIFLMLLDVVNIKNPFANKVGRISFACSRFNAFVTGFFAVLIASPCTAPFMGIAIGYTLTQSIYIYYPVFLALSIGYALPFTLAGFFPKYLHQVLPKPGKWMDILKKIFAIPVFLTCVWLVWVLFSQLSADKRGLDNRLEWRAFDAKQVETLVKAKQPVFIDFTAKWCITCLVNKKIALQTDEFAKLVQSKKIHLFVADWTNEDADISSALESYGRNSIPLYVYYDGKDGKYVILPQLLTPGIMEEYLK